MDDRIARLESIIEQLRSVTDSLQQRVQVLEANLQGRAPSLPSAADALAGAQSQTGQTASPAVPARRDQYDPIVILSLTGRLFLVLAGGFFLRAMTEAGVLAVPVGIALAFAYALVWLFLSDRAGRRAQITSALFHAAASAMVAFPLVLEATTKFNVLGAGGSTVVIFALTAVFLLVACRQRLQGVAWVTVSAAVPISLALLLKTGVMAPFAFYLIALGIATLWLGYVFGWTLLRWPVALAADLVVVGMTLRALAPQHQDSLPVAVLMQLTLLGAYVVSIAIRTLVRNRNVTLFEIVQTAAALVLGFGGAVFLTRATGAVPIMIGLVSLVAGVACYGVAFAFVDSHEELRRNVYFYTTLALVLVLAGLTLDLRQQWLGVVFAVFGVLAAVSWSRYGRLYMLLHGAVYVVAAAIASGTLSYSVWALAASPAGSWVLPGGPMLVVLIAAALAVWFASVRPDPEGGGVASALRLVIATVLVLVACGCAAGCLAPVTESAGSGVNLGALATVRTGVLAAAVLLVAWIGRRARFREWAWLIYPMLVLIGLKMVAQDFKYSRPATLFIALALYGAALIVAPRLRRGRE